MSKLCRLKYQLSKVEDAALCLSGGKDSRLLLEVLIERGAKFSVLTFNEGWTRQQQKAVDELTIRHNLRVYSYEPRYSMMIGKGDGDLALVSGYAIDRGGEAAVLFRDIVAGDRCAFDIGMPISASIQPPLVFSTVITGVKKGESHWAMGGKPFLAGERVKVGETEVWAPLYSWTDKNVIDALKTLGIDYQEPSDENNTGNISCCSLCLQTTERGEVMCPKEKKAIPAVAWDPVENLQTWQQMAGIGASEDSRDLAFARE